MRSLQNKLKPGQQFRSKMIAVPVCTLPFSITGGSKKAFCVLAGAQNDIITYKHEIDTHFNVFREIQRTNT